MALAAGSIPQCLNVIVLVKAATVFQWHLQGFRLIGAGARSGLPSVDREVRDLTRQMNAANPLWGAPRIPPQALEARHRGQPNSRARLLTCYA